MSTEREVELHVHDHIGPILERVSRIEADTMHHRTYIDDLKSGVGSLNERVERVERSLSEKMDRHHEILSDKITKLQTKVLAFVMALGILLGGVQVLYYTGAIGNNPNQIEKSK